MDMLLPGGNGATDDDSHSEERGDSALFLTAFCFWYHFDFCSFFSRHRSFISRVCRCRCKSAISSVSWSQSLKFFPWTATSTRLSLKDTWVLIVFTSFICCILLAQNSWSSFGRFDVVALALLADPNLLDFNLPFLYWYPLWSTFFRACSRSSPRIVRILGFCTQISPAASFTLCWYGVSGSFLNTSAWSRMLAVSSSDNSNCY